MDNPYDLFNENKASGDAIASDAAACTGETISDRYLNRAIGACCTDENGHFLLSKPIRNLIARYAPAYNPTMNWIPQERRRSFLNDLASITGRALPPDEPVRSEPMLLDQEVNVTVRGSVPVGAEPTLVCQDRKQILDANKWTESEPTSASQDAALISNGYEPIAVRGKVPLAKGWNKRSNTIEAIAAERAAHPSATNIGLRTGRLVGIDIDIFPVEHVHAIKRLANELLGFTWFERVGAKGAMLCYRNETPIEKITVSANHVMRPGKIEILGTGQQFVAYGVHPDTGKSYVWTQAPFNGEPLRKRLDQLPELTPETLREFAERAAELLTELGYTEVKVSGAGETAERPRLDAPAAEFELDAPINVQRARIWLRSLVESGDVAVEGQGGDARTYQVVCRLRDLGLSPQTALELLAEPGGWNEHCRPPWEDRKLATKVRNAYSYGRNTPGADAIFFSPLETSQPPSPPPELLLPAAAGETTSASPNKLIERFRGRWPDEYEELPELNFWDEDKTLPRCPDGCIAIVYGEFGSHKTNTVLAMVLHAVLDEGARVCYAAGEGAHGVGKQRIPAHCKARGIPTKELRGRLRIVPAVPLFVSDDQVAAFIEAQRDLSPDIVVVDTLATALAGEDENSSKAAAFLTANGPAGQIRCAFKALVILPAHQGKDAGRKVRGHSGFMGNADVVLHVDAYKAAGAIKVTVEKMRDGRDGFSIFFKVAPTGSKMVPVPEKITEEEYLELMTGRTSGRPGGAELTFNQRRDMLVDHGAVDFDGGLCEADFAEILAGPRPGDDDTEAVTRWKAEVERERKSLKNAHGKRSYKEVLCSQQVPAGSDKRQWRWYIANSEAAGIEAAPEPLAGLPALFAPSGDAIRMQHQGGASAIGYPS
jgi:hypothetical protein